MTAEDLAAAEAVDLLTQATGESYELAGPLCGGETGAHRVIGPSGESLVVKWERDSVAKALRGEGVVFSERLRTAGWPVPREWVIDVGPRRFVIQTFMPGVPVRVVTGRLVDQLLDLHGRRIGLAEPTDPVHWPSALITTLTQGGRGYCLHDSLRTFDGRTSQLVARIEKFGRSLKEDDLPGHDIVHWDMHFGNMLEDQGGLSAIVDTDFAMVGDAAFDLVMLALTCRALPCEADTQARLWAAAFDDLEEIRRQAYLAHLFLRILDWPIRRGAVGEVEFWLEQSAELLDI